MSLNKDSLETVIRTAVLTLGFTVVVAAGASANEPARYEKSRYDNRQSFPTVPNDDDKTKKDYPEMYCVVPELYGEKKRKLQWNSLPFDPLEGNTIDKPSSVRVAGYIRTGNNYHQKG